MPAINTGIVSHLVSPNPPSSFFFSLQMNDFVRDKFTTVDGAIPLPAEILAGGCVSVLSDIL